MPKIHTTPPVHFFPSVEVAACYLLWEGKILLLKRARGKPEGGKWGVPAGKLEIGETALSCCRRELFEETGILLSESALSFLSALYIEKQDVSYVYHMFVAKLKHPLEVVLNDEHDAFLWTSVEEAKMMPLMACGLEALENFIVESVDKI